MKYSTIRILFASAVLLSAACSCGKDTVKPNVVVRPKGDKYQMAANIKDYLAKDYPSKVTNVQVTSDKVIIKGNCGGSGTYLLAEITPWQDVTELEKYPYTQDLSGGGFTVTVDRIVPNREGIRYDKVFSKWAVVKVDGDRQTLDSHARYADDVVPKKSPEAVPLRNKKGFGAGDIDLYFSDCKEMNVGSITMNVVLNDYIKGEGSGYSYGGQNYSLGAFKDYVDRVTRRAGEMDLVVSAIILCQTNSIFKDPENKGGNYTMPNLTTAKAFNLYAAALEHMASTHCTPGNRISHWIMHNEVDFANEWTNMGDQPMMRYLDRYIKSMRICYNIARQYDQNASVLGSYTHCWAKADGSFAPKMMLEKTVEYSSAEGDFRWGVAYHPYPQNLTKPSFWIDDTQATYSLNSKYVTFKNLEVIDAWIRQKENFYKGKTKRVLFLSEQGTNSPSYSESDLALQAAGGAWAWKKVSKLDGIDAIQWHNWADNKAEGGLRIGLRTFAEGSVSNLTPKPVWYVWKAAGTAEEDSVFDQYKTTLGISDWDSILNTVEQKSAIGSICRSVSVIAVLPVTEIVCNKVYL